MNYFKEWLNDFKYMNKQAKTQVIVTGVLILLGIIGLIYFFITKNNSEDVNKLQVDLNDYISYSYQDNGEISVVNLNENKTISKIQVGEVKKLLSENKEKLEKVLANPFKLVEHSEKIYALDINGSIIEYGYDKKSMKELRRIKLEKLPINFKIYDDEIFVSYLDSNKIDVYNITKGEKVRGFESESEVTSFDIVDSYLYIGTKQGIEVINTSNVTDKNIINLDDESVSTEVFASEFEESKVSKEIKSQDSNSQVELKNEEKKDESQNSNKKVKTVYVLNNFASDNKNSIVIKMQDGKPVDLIELKKENPIALTESEKFLYVVCKGLADHDGNDNVVVINKNNFKVKNRITISDKPNSLSMLDNEIAYISHDNGEITKVNLEDESMETSFTVPNTKGLIVKKYKK